MGVGVREQLLVTLAGLSPRLLHAGSRPARLSAVGQQPTSSKSSSAVGAKLVGVCRDPFMHRKVEMIRG